MPAKNVFNCQLLRGRFFQGFFLDMNFPPLITAGTFFPRTIFLIHLAAYNGDVYSGDVFSQNVFSLGRFLGDVFSRYEIPGTFFP